MKQLATLSISGWVDTPAAKADKLLSYFFVSNYSQTLLHKGHIKSLAYIVQQYGNDPVGLQSSMQDALTVHLTPYFDAIDLNVRVTPEVGNDSVLEIKIDAAIVDGEVREVLGKLINVKDAAIVAVKDMNNG